MFTSSLDPSFQRIEISFLRDMDMNHLIEGNNRSQRYHFTCRCVGWEITVAQCMPSVPSQVAHRLVRNSSPSASSTLGRGRRLEVQASAGCKAETRASEASAPRPAAWLTQALAFPSLMPCLKQKSNTCLDFLKEMTPSTHRRQA